jgi:hypothetical protein
MQPYVPADAVEVDITYLFDGQRCQNVVHYAYDSVPVPDDMVELGNEIISAWDSGMKAWMPSTLSLIEVKLTDLTTQISPSVFATTGLPVVGTNVSPALPNSNALVLTKRTALRGRSYRGRIYVPGLIEGQVTANAVSSAYQTNYLNFWNGLLTITTTQNSFEMVVFSKKQNGSWLAQGILTPVIGFTTDGQVDSQRRRLPGRGS